MNKTQIDMIVATLPLDQKVRKLAGYNFRCPICHDSKKNSSLKRGWIYYNKSRFVCYNCGARIAFKIFIKQYYPMAFTDYLKTLGIGKAIKTREQEETELLQRINPLESLDLTPLLSLDDNHIAYKYIEERLIPLKHKQKLYYTDNYMQWIHDKIGLFEKSKIPSSDRRIVIPHFNKFNKIFCVQGRDLKQYSNCRYLTVLFDESHPNIGGLDTINKSKTIYLTEGYFDHTFIPNSLCINSADVDLNYLLTIANKDRFVFVYDNEPRNVEVVKRMKKVIKLGFRIVIWPKTNGKDINNMILNGMKIDKILCLILANTYKGLTANIKLNNILRR